MVETEKRQVTDMTKPTQTINRKESPLEDRQIIDLFLERSEQAIDQLSRKYGRVCEALAKNILGNPRDAEECVSDAYLAVWNTVPPEQPDPLLSYLCRIVRNLSLKKHRQNTAKKRNSFYDIALEELEAVLPYAVTVEAEADGNALAEAINRFLAGLDRDSRVLFVRRYWYGDSVTDLAKRFHITAHNATVRLSRLREKLKAELLQEGIAV